MQTLPMIIRAVRNILTGGEPTSNDRYADLEIQFHVLNAINALLKPALFDVSYNFDAATIPNGVCYSTYEGCPIDTKGRISLPAMPLVLPMGAGVWNVFPDGHPEEEWYPLLPGERSLLAGVREYASLFDEETTYTWQGSQIQVHPASGKTLPPTATVVLCVADFQGVGPNDLLPISGEMMEAVIQRAVAQLAPSSKTTTDADTDPRPRKTDAA